MQGEKNGEVARLPSQDSSSSQLTEEKIDELIDEKIQKLKIEKLKKELSQIKNQLKHSPSYSFNIDQIEDVNVSIDRQDKITRADFLGKTKNLTIVENLAWPQDFTPDPAEALLTARL